MRKITAELYIGNFNNHIIYDKIKLDERLHYQYISDNLIIQRSNGSRFRIKLFQEEIMKIGFFDSGLGGLSVLHETLKILPCEDYIYFADTKNIPYGVKTKDEVKKLVFDAMDFIMSLGVEAVVIACNTATSVAIEDVRKRYSIPVIGMEPAVKPAIEKNILIDKCSAKQECSDKRVLVTATKLTLKEEKLHNLISMLEGENLVDFLELQKLVELAEADIFDEKTITGYLSNQLKDLEMDEYHTIVLGCTHFTFFKDTIRKVIGKDIEIIDGNKGTAANLKRIIEQDNILGEGSGNIDFYISKEKVEDEQTLERYRNLFKRLDSIQDII